MQTYSNDLSRLCKKPSNTVHDNLTISESILFATCLKRIPEPLGTAAFFHSSIFKSELIPGTLYILPQQRSWSIRLVKGFAFSSHPRCTPGPLNQKKPVASRDPPFEAWESIFQMFPDAVHVIISTHLQHSACG